MDDTRVSHTIVRAWLVALLVTGLPLNPAEGQLPADAQSVEALVTDSAGSPLAGVLVTARGGAGVAVSGYTDREGRVSLPGGLAKIDSLEAYHPDYGLSRVEASEIEASRSVVLRLGPLAEAVEPTAAEYLNLLPDGYTKRRFILDCTGCHVWSRRWVHGQSGSPRDEATWKAAVDRMLTLFGPGTGFPIISSWPDPSALASWLHEHFGAGETPAASWPDPKLMEGSESAMLTEYDIPVPMDLPHDLAVAPNGSVVITGMFTHQMYVLDPASGAFTTRAIEVPNANPRAVEVDAAGRWWVLLGAALRVARYDPGADEWTSWGIGAYPHSIDRDSAGRVWFNGHFSVDPEIVGVLDPQSDRIQRFEIPYQADGDVPPGESSIPYGLRVAPDGSVWGTQLRGGHLFRLDPATGQVQQWPMPSQHAGPRRLDIGPDGMIWIPGYAAGRIARFDPRSETFQEWDVPIEDALPYVIRVDQRRGTIWIGTGHADAMVRFDPAAESFTVFPLPTRGALIRHLDVDEERGQVWAAYGAAPGVEAKVLRLEPNR